MTDRELLELAAKAAGIEMDAAGQDMRDSHGGYDGLRVTGRLPSIWNPLTSDGDALRLAVKLGLGLAAFDDRADVYDGHWVSVCEYHNGDPDAATRRAITRAAAAIGAAL